jgi:hypothetical protein
MLDTEAPLTEIGQLLRRRRLLSTAILATGGGDLPKRHDTTAAARASFHFAALVAHNHGHMLTIPFAHQQESA